MSPEILNSKFKVGNLNLETFEIRRVLSCKLFSLEWGYFSARELLNLRAMESKWRIE